MKTKKRERQRKKREMKEVGTELKKKRKKQNQKRKWCPFVARKIRQVAKQKIERYYARYRSEEERREVCE